jgi:hypothetical protein
MAVIRWKIGSKSRTAEQFWYTFLLKYLDNIPSESMLVSPIYGFCTLGITRDRSITDTYSWWPFNSDSWVNGTLVYRLIKNYPFKTLLSVDDNLVVTQETSGTNLRLMIWQKVTVMIPPANDLLEDLYNGAYKNRCYVAQGTCPRIHSFLRHHVIKRLDFRLKTESG